MAITYRNSELEELPHLATGNLDAILRATLFGQFCRRVQRSLRTDIFIARGSVQDVVHSVLSQCRSLSFEHSADEGPAEGAVHVSIVQYGSFYLFRLPTADGSSLAGIAVHCDPPERMPQGSSAMLMTAVNELKAVRSLDHREARPSRDYNDGPVTGTLFDSEDTWKCLYMAVPQSVSDIRL